MDKRVNDTSHQTAEEIDRGKLVSFANNNAVPFGKKVLQLLKDNNLNENDLAAEFNENKLTPNQPRFVSDWLRGKSRPSYQLKHMDVILKLGGVGVDYFLESSGSKPASSAAPASAGKAPAPVAPLSVPPVAAAPATTPAPEKRVLSLDDISALSKMRLLSTDNVAFMKALDACLCVDEVPSAKLAAAFKAAKLMPAEESYCEKWRKGGVNYYASNEHLVVVADILGISIPKLHDLLSTQILGDAKHMSYVTADTNRKKYGGLIKALLVHVDKTQAQLHAAMFSEKYPDDKPLIGENVNNIYNFVAGVSRVDAPRYTAVATFFGVDDETFDKAFQAYMNNEVIPLEYFVIQPPADMADTEFGRGADASGANEGPEEFGEGKDTSAADASEEDAADSGDTPVAGTDDVAASTDETHTTDGEPAADAAEDTPVDDPLTELAALVGVEDDGTDDTAAEGTEQVVEASVTTLEDDLQGVFAGYDTTRAAAPETMEDVPVTEETAVKESVVETFPAVTQASWLQPQKTHLEAYSADETGVLKMAYARFNGMSEPERAKVLMGLVTNSDINPDLLSGFAFSLMVAHLASVDGAERDKGLVTLFAKSVGMDAH